MSKSLGNVIAPQKVSDTLGAEIIRLWVASADYSGELYISDEILKRVVESYRRIRNTLRFLLANTADFDAAPDLLPPERWPEIDRYALAMTREMAAAAIADYARFEFHLVAQRIQTFCSEDLGGFYLDVLKDRLYTCGRDSRGEARGAIGAAPHHADPASPHGADPFLHRRGGVGGTPPAARDESVFFHTWDGRAARRRRARRALIVKWKRLREIRALVQKSLEELRQSGGIGSSLQAEVAIAAPEGDRALLESLGDDLRFVLITSTAAVRAGGEALAVRVAASAHAKCERCWHYRDDVGRATRATRASAAAACRTSRAPGEERQHA